jgi:signal peptidase I
MFDFDEKQQPEFGIIDADDDKDIEVQQVKNEAKQSVLTEIFLLVRDVVFVLLVMILLGVFIAQPVVVEGTSMLPNLHEGERLIVNKMIYYKIESFSWGHIERGDIVVFWYPHDPDKSYVKRVIGLPEDTVEIRNGKVIINGQEMQENYLDPIYNQSNSNIKETRVDKHYYFVMGDNRDNSSDSRNWGFVPEKYIYGKAFFRYWRPANFGFINKGDYQLNEQSNDTKASNKPVENFSSPQPNE